MRSGTVLPVMKAFLKTGEAARYLSISTRTIRRWDKARKLVCYHTPGGHRRIATVELERLLTGQEPGMTGKKTVLYSRVSFHEQKKRGDLQCQVDAGKKYCERRGYRVDSVYADVVSGLNTNRRGLKRFCRTGIKAVF
ncbi:MAG: helix-turn-helix domain-containing protein [Candidatus Odinarchaeota archaeon]